MEEEKRTEKWESGDSKELESSTSLQEETATSNEELISPPQAEQEEECNAEGEQMDDQSEREVSANEEAQNEPTPTDPKPMAPPPVNWQFGGSLPERKAKAGSGQKQFFVMFGVICGICLLLLALTLFLGNGGIQLVRNITKERIVYVRNDDGSSGLLTSQEAADKVRESTVSVSVISASGSGVGSGFVYSADGYICTNYHVIQEMKSVQVVLPDGKAYDATVKGYNEDADLAVLKIDAEGLIPVEFGNSDDLLVGDEVVAIGTPAKLDYAGTANFGAVTTTKRLVVMRDESTGSITKKMTLIQTDTDLNPGNSGGPLADMYGKVVGVVVMKVSTYNGTDYDGIGFALPIDGVRQIVDEIIQKGSFTGDNPIAEGRSLLGVAGHGGYEGLWYYVDPSTSKVTQSDVQQSGYHQMTATGIYVLEVNGANARGKINSGDVITQVNGLNVMDTTDLINAVNRYYAGETVTLTVRRGTQTVYIDIILYEENAS